MIYQLDPATFFDSDGDGSGDLDVKADLLADSEYEPATRESVYLAAHGYRWLRVG